MNSGHPPENPVLATKPIGLTRGIACKDCMLHPLCLPLSLGDDGVDQLEAIIHRGRPLQKGDYLFQQGDSFDSIYAIRSGSLKAYSITSTGQEQIVGFFFPTEIVGLAAVNCYTHPVSAVALETTAVCEIPFARMEQLFEELPALRQRVMSVMGKELRDYQEMMLILSKKTADERVATFLMNLALRFARRGFSANAFRLTMSRNEIGNYLGMAVETVSRVFTRFQKQDRIRVHGKEVEILDPNALWALAGTVPIAMREQDCIPPNCTHQ